jgi:transposase
MLLGLEEVEQVAASSEAKIEAASPAERANRATKRQINRGSLPAHLPRIEVVVDIEDHSCPGCGNALHRIGEDASERSISYRRSSRCWLFAGPNMPADLARARLVYAPAPNRLIEGGLPN